MRIGVFMGGKSLEREVSLQSGRTICDHVDATRYTIVPLFQDITGELFILPWKFLHRGKIADFHHRLPLEAELIVWDQLKSLIDFAFLALHGRYGEDGSLQGMLELLHIPYLGSSVLTSALTANKYMQKQFLKTASLDTAPGFYLPASIAANAVHHASLINKLFTDSQLSFPVIIKPNCEGSSLGVSQATNHEELIIAITKAAHVDDQRIQAVLIENQLSGMEFTCIVLYKYETQTYSALTPTQVIPDSSDKIWHYDQKYMPGRATKKTPPACTVHTQEQIQSLCISVAHAMDIRTIARIDGFVTDDNKVVFMDCNPLPGMGPASPLFREAAEHQWNHTYLINYLIESEYVQRKIPMNKKITYAAVTLSQKKRKRIAVLMGGRSAEREISLESGRNVVYKLSPALFEAIPLFVSASLELYLMDQKLLVCHSTQEIEDQLHNQPPLLWGNFANYADFAFIALHGGEGENGTIQGMLETVGIPYNGSSILASALCMDKHKTNIFLKNAGFDTPHHIFIQKDQWGSSRENLLNAILETIPFPLIVKPHDQGSSFLIQKVCSKQDLQVAIDTIICTSASGASSSGALIEECITGTELTIGVLGNDTVEALPPTQTISKHAVLSMEEKFLPGCGENKTPATLPPESLIFIKKIVEDAYRILQCSGYARIDCFYQPASASPSMKERLIILEINTLPALTPATCLFHQAAEVGIKAMDLVTRIIQLGLSRNVYKEFPSHHINKTPSGAIIKNR